MSRREKIQPEDVGLPRGPRRRVRGLRREEVATLAGVSVDYYIQVERGGVDGVSDDVLAAISHALNLDDAERAHLFALVRAATTRRPPRSPEPTDLRVPVALRQLLDAITEAPAVIQSGGLDIVAANSLGRALYSSAYDAQGECPNLARYVYLDDDALRFFHDWDAVADEVAAILRAELAHSPSSALEMLVSELSVGSQAFRRRWAAHDVVDHRRGFKVLHHAAVGELRLRYEALEITGMPRARLLGYTADPDYPATREALKLLGLVSHGALSTLVGVRETEG